MHNIQKLLVKWDGKNYSKFGALYGLKQGAVLTSILFIVYIGSMLQRLKESGIGCYLSNNYVEM